jgi:hypothetical protein
LRRSERIFFYSFFVAQGISFIRANSQTIEEAAHLGAGYSYLATATFVLTPNTRRSSKNSKPFRYSFTIKFLSIQIPTNGTKETVLSSDTTSFINQRSGLTGCLLWPGWSLWVSVDASSWLLVCGPTVSGQRRCAAGHVHCMLRAEPAQQIFVIIC